MIESLLFIRTDFTSGAQLSFREEDTEETGRMADRWMTDLLCIIQDSIGEYKKRSGPFAVQLREGIRSIHGQKLSSKSAARVGIPYFPTSIACFRASDQQLRRSYPTFIYRMKIFLDRRLQRKDFDISRSEFSYSFVSGSNCSPLTPMRFSICNGGS